MYLRYNRKKKIKNLENHVFQNNKENLNSIYFIYAKKILA
jgi:hypothetical protein